MDRENILNEIKIFLEERFELEFGTDPDYDTDLFEYGYVDSLESLVIINFLEKNYKIKISPDDLIDNPINSLNQMSDFIIDMKG